MSRKKRQSGSDTFPKRDRTSRKSSGERIEPQETIAPRENLSHADAMIGVAARALAGTFRKPKRKYSR